jgi:hypothetical protein
MSHRREGLLAQIEAGVLDDSVPVSSLLQKCIVLGGKPGSEKMRAWVRQELNGYGADPIPDYRRIPTGLVALITNHAGYNPMTQRINPSALPRQVRDFLREQGVDLEVATLGGGIGELEALANRGETEHQLMPGWGRLIIDVLNRYNTAANSRVEAVYWPLSDASLRGLLVRIRTALAEMVAELLALTPPAQEVPDRAAADQAVSLVVTGERATVVVARQQTDGGGTNVIAPSEAAPVTVSGGGGTAIGSQTASGPGASVAGNQTAHGNHNSMTGKDDAVAAAQSGKEYSWTRHQTIWTIVGVLVAIVGAYIAYRQWKG